MKTWRGGSRSEQLGRKEVSTFGTGSACRALKIALLAGATAVAGASIAPSIAQDAGTVEKVTVTGSRIKQKGLVSQSPVTTIGNQVIRYQGSPDITATLNNLPAVNFSQDLTQGALADGTATVDLRSQGAARTLVLIDGQRLMPGDPLQSSPAADLNMIPTSMVERIEVVTGGASAVYGSDAMTGVVNFVMRKDFSGIQLDVGGGAHQTANDDANHIRRLHDAGFTPPDKNKWDGQQFSADLIFGANTDNGRGNVTAYVGYQDVDAIYGGDRVATACAYAEDGAGDLFCLASSNYARIRAIGGYNSGGDYFIGNADWVAFDPSDGAQTFNFAPANLLQRPDTRLKAGAFAHYDISDAVKAYGSVMYFKDRSPVIAAPSGSFLQNGAFTFNCDNPLMTEAQADLLGCLVTQGDFNSGRLTEDRTVLLGRRNIEGGNRETPLEHSQIRFAGGLRGDFAPGWDYDLYAVHGETSYVQTYFNDWSISRKVRALQVDPLTGNCKSFDSGLDPNCVPLNIFTGLGTLTPEMIGYVSASPIIIGNQTQTILGGQVTGDLESLGIKAPLAETAVQLALGVEYRRDSLRFVPSADWAAADLEGNTQLYLLTDAALDVSELFAEATIPLVEEKPFFKLLQFNGGYRTSDYSTSAGVVHTYKYGMEWAPSADIRFRGSFQAATRAPGLLELYGPPGFALTNGFSDTCLDPAAPNRPTKAQCLNVGVSSAAYDSADGSGDCISGQCSLLTGANPNLKSERAETLTYGFIFTPSFLKNFTFTADYYKIDITDYITSGVNYSVIYSQCLTAGSLCDLIIRDPQGELNEKGFGFDQRNLNIGQQIAEGIDIESTLRFDLEDAGGLNLSFIGTKQIDQIIIDVAEGQLGKRDCVGYWGITCGTPYYEWRHQLRADWNTPWDLDLSFTWRHLSGVSFDGNSTDPNLNGGGGSESIFLPEIPAFDYLDIAGRYVISDNYELTFGMQNVLDKDPPAMDQANTAGNALNTLNTNYDTLGRFMFVTGTVRY